MRRERASRQEIDQPLIGPVFDTLEELEGYRLELRESGLFERIDEAQRWFNENVTGETPRGHRPVFGGIARGLDARLYAVLRKLRPDTAVETGVCAGTSTSFILQALDHNGAGRLVSIDYPEIAGTEVGDRQFWEGKGGAVVPAGMESGWAIPDHLRGRWELVTGRSQEQLPPLLGRLGTIDFFFHDGEHSYECMSFEYELAFRHLREGGMLASDDVNWNTAFEDFAESVARSVHRLGNSVALLQK